MTRISTEYCQPLTAFKLRGIESVITSDLPSLTGDPLCDVPRGSLSEYVYC